MVKRPGARDETRGVAIAPSVLREPYGHFGGVITLAVRAPRDRCDDAGLVSVLQAAVDDWSAHLVDFAAEEGLHLFERWEGRVRALVLPETLDGPVVVAAGREDAWRYENASVVPWHVLRTVAVAVSRHLEAEGWDGAKVVKPKAYRLPGRVYQAPNAAVLRAVERRSVDWPDAVAVKRRLVDAALRWVEQIEGPTYLSLGQFPMSFPSGVPDELARILGDLDVHVDCASGSVKDAVAFARLGWREFDLGWGGRAVDRETRLAQGERLAAVLGGQGAALSYGCVSFDDKLWPIEDPAGAVRSWRSNTHEYRDAAGSLVLDAFWTQLLTDDHLAREPAVAGTARVTEGRRVLQIGEPAAWLEASDRDAQRDIGRAMMAGCLSDKASMRALDRIMSQEWRAAQPVPQDDRPLWALEVRPPEGMARSLGRHHVSLAGWDHQDFTERFDAPDGRELTVTQKIPGESPSAGNPWTEIAEVRVQVMATSSRDASRAVFWTERGRRMTVGINEAAVDHLDQVVRDLHRAAKVERPVMRTPGRETTKAPASRTDRGLAVYPPWDSNPEPAD